MTFKIFLKHEKNEREPAASFLLRDTCRCFYLLFDKEELSARIWKLRRVDDWGTYMDPHLWKSPWKESFVEGGPDYCPSRAPTRDVLAGWWACLQLWMSPFPHLKSDISQTQTTSKSSLKWKEEVGSLSSVMVEEFLSSYTHIIITKLLPTLVLSYIQ